MRLDKTNMISMPLESIMPDAEIPFPLYMHMKRSGRMVPVRQAGESLGQKRFVALKRELHRELWVPKSFEKEIAAYMAYLETTWGLIAGGGQASEEAEERFLSAEAAATAEKANSLLNSTGTTPEEKRAGLSKMARSLLKQFAAIDSTDSASQLVVSDKCKAFADEFLSCLQAESIYDCVLALRSRQVPTDHSCLVGSIAAVIAAGTEIVDPRWISNLLIACTFHDIGMIDVSAEILQKSPSEWALKEQIEFENHVARGVELLSASDDSFPNDVIRMIHEHHEQPNGKGFPSGKKERELFDGTHFLILANYCCDLIAGKITGLALSPKSAFTKLLEDAPSGRKSRDNLQTLFDTQEAQVA